MTLRARLERIQRALPWSPRPSGVRALTDQELVGRGHEVAVRVRACTAEGGVVLTAEQLRLLERLERLEGEAN